MPISQAEVCSQRGRTYISNIDVALAHHHVRVRRSNYQQAEIKKFLGAIRTPAAARSMSTGIEQAQQRLGRASGRAHAWSPVSNKCTPSKAQNLRAGGPVAPLVRSYCKPWGRRTVAVLPGSKKQNYQK